MHKHNLAKVEKARHPLSAAVVQKETATLIDKRYCWRGSKQLQVPVRSNLMQPGATIQQTQLVLDASDGSILLICQAPVARVDNVALHRISSDMKPCPLMTVLEPNHVRSFRLTLQSQQKPYVTQVQDFGNGEEGPAHLDVLGSSRLDQHAGAMLNTPSDNHLLSNALTLLANLPDDGVLRIKQYAVWF